MRAQLETYPEVELVLQEVGQAFQVQFLRKRAEVADTPEVRLLSVLTGEMSREQIQSSLSLKDEKHFRTACLGPALKAGLIEMTIPDKPRGSKQRYRITVRGRKRLENYTAGNQGKQGETRNA